MIKRSKICPCCGTVISINEEVKEAQSDAINEFVTRFEEKYSRITVHLGEFRKYQFEMHRLAEEMLRSRSND